MPQPNAGKPLDRRVRKTREALYAAFAALIIERGYDALTIQDVLDAADVGRSTFYAHFTGKPALLRFGFARLREQLTSQSVVSGSTAPFAFLPGLLQHARIHTGLYRALLGSHGGTLAQQELRAIVGVLIAEDLTRYPLVPDSNPAFASAFLTSGLLGALESWIGAPKPEIAPFVAAFGQITGIFFAVAPASQT